MRTKSPTLIDTREPGALRTAVSLAFEAHGYDSMEVTLKYGDYVTGHFLVERKTRNDLSASIVDGRVFRELRGALANEEGLETVLLLEGIWMEDAGISTARGVHPNSLRAVLLWAGRHNVRVLFSRDQSDTIEALLWLARTKPEEDD